MKLKALFSTAVALSVSLSAASIEKIELNEKLDVVDLKNKTLNLDVGVGSGAYHFKGDAKNVFYSITDRGPNIKCKDSKKLMGENLCKKGKIFPTPNFSPTIYKYEVNNGSYKILDKIQIKDKDGKPVSGISNAGTENAYDIKGEKIAFDPHGLDAEALIKLSDGTYWISEEYGASILHIAKDGKILKRVVPASFEKNLKDANYEVSATLPSIVGKRPLNRGIESLAISPDEKSLYFIMQSPLANPTPKDYKKSRNVRLFKYDIAKNKAVAQYVYQIDTPKTFTKDNKTKQNAVKVSEMFSVGNEELIVLERISKTTKFYKINLKNAENILGSKWDDEKTRPSLEQSMVKTLDKTLVLDTSEIEGIPSKIEGVAYIDENNWFLINDNDFGIDNSKSFIVKLKK